MHLNYNLKTLRVLFCRVEVDRPGRVLKYLVFSVNLAYNCLVMHDRAKEDRPLYSELC